MAKAFDIRIKRVRTGLPASNPVILPVSNLSFSAAKSSIPTLSFDVQQIAIGERLIAGEEFAVEFWNGNSWAEPKQWSRFLLKGMNWDDLDPTIATNVTCIGFVEQKLAGTRLESQTGAARVYSDGVGVIAYHPVDEAQSRGALAGVTVNYNAVTDSYGQLWSTDDLDLELEAGQSCLEILKVLADQGVLEWWSEGHELVVVRPGTGEDRTGSDPIYIGRQATELPVSVDAGEYATAVLLRDDTGAAKTFTKPDALGWGRIEKEVNASGVTNGGTLENLGQLEIIRARTQWAYTVTENIRALDAIPLIDYGAGDQVLVRRRHLGTWQSMNVAEVQVTRDGDAELSVHVGLEDSLASLEQKLSKRAESLGSTVGGSGRAKFPGSGMSGGSSGAFRVGTIAPNYVSGGGAPAPVIFQGSTEPSAPLPFLARYSPFAGDTVAVGTAGAVGDIILDRIASAHNNGIVIVPRPGTVEELALVDGWSEYDPDRYGHVRVNRVSSDWVLLSGAVIWTGAGDPPENPEILRLPGAFLPERQAITGNDNLYLNTATGVLSYVVSKPVAGTPVVLNGIWWNISTNVQILYSDGSQSVIGTDVDGLIWTGGRASGGLISFRDLPAGKAPATDTRLSIPGSTNGQAFADGTIKIGQLPDSPYSLDLSFWQQATGTQLAWTTLTLTNGYVHGTNPVQYAKTPAGLTLLRGNWSGGVAGQKMGTLPIGSRPGYEVKIGDYTITSGGAIVTRQGANTSSNFTFFDHMFIAGA